MTNCMEHIGPEPQPLNLAEGIDFTRFNVDEQAQLSTFLDSLDRYPIGQHPIANTTTAGELARTVECTIAQEVLSCISEEKLREAQSWAELYEARAAGAC
ncbi:MAG: hypothetical protein J2P37_29975 [Ktedonobacteraceae bacterium]|nr:hypothetical protein [Ktedonobacteraceae bacterium]